MKIVLHAIAQSHEGENGMPDSCQVQSCQRAETEDFEQRLTSSRRILSKVFVLVSFYQTSGLDLRHWAFG